MYLLISWVSTLLNAAAVLVELVFVIPIVGRLLKWLWSLILTLVGLIFGIFDSLLWLMGLRMDKKLRAGVIILRDEQGQPLMQPEQVYDGWNQTIETLYATARVRVLPAWEFQQPPKLANDLPLADQAWVRTNSESSRKNVLEVRCDLPAFGQDLLTTGSEFEFLMASLNFRGNFRRVTGLGAPLIVFIIDSMGENKSGCSLGPLSDYVTAVKAKPACICHELGHACNLLHVKDTSNLMHGRGCKQDKLEWWQILLLRASRHVSYL